jgi:hypothetical protein
MGRSSPKLCRRLFSVLVLTLAVAAAAATPSLALGRGAGTKDLVYAGRCGLFLLSANPSHRTFYRYDLRQWRYGDERDFNCFVLENY